MKVILSTNVRVYTGLRNVWYLKQFVFNGIPKRIFFFRFKTQFRRIMFPLKILTMWEKNLYGFFNLVKISISNMKNIEPEYSSNVSWVILIQLCSNVVSSVLTIKCTHMWNEDFRVTTKMHERKQNKSNNLWDLQTASHICAQYK